MRYVLLGTLVATLLVAGACSSDPADVAGSYTVATTSRTNGCMFDNWTEGETSNNIPVTITQDGENATAVLDGVVGGWVNLVLGSKTFTGTVDGNSMELVLHGTTSASEGNCTWTVNATLDADIDGDVLTGQIRYEKATNGNPDCAPFDGCVSYQCQRSSEEWPEPLI